MTNSPWELDDSKKLLKGIQLFHEKEFFLAHDEWEDVWQDMRGRRRIFWQALIQLAIALYHLENGNSLGYNSMKSKSFQKLDKICTDMKSGIACQFKDEIAHLSEHDSLDFQHNIICFFIQPSILEF